MNVVWHNDVENDKYHFISPVKAHGNWHTMHTIPHGSDMPGHSMSALGGARCVIWQKRHLFMIQSGERSVRRPCSVFADTRKSLMALEKRTTLARRKMIDGGCKSQRSLVLIKRTLLDFLSPFRSQGKSWFSVLFLALYMKLLPVTFNAHWLRLRRGPRTEGDYLSLKAIQWMWRFCVVRVTVSELITDEQ